MVTSDSRTPLAEFEYRKTRLICPLYKSTVLKIDSKYE